jgi:disulfide bond formation protein DsbB
VTLIQRANPQSLGFPLGLALAVPTTLMAGALGSQYIGGLVPCEMCMWQRWPHYAAIALALLAFIVRPRAPRRALIALAALAILVSGVYGVYHAGVEYKFWLGPDHCTRLPGAGGDLLNDILTAPMIRCDEPQWNLFGISLAGFNAIISISASLFILNLLRKST